MSISQKAGVQQFYTTGISCAAMLYLSAANAGVIYKITASGQESVGSARR